MATLPIPTVNPMLLLGARVQQNSDAAQGAAPIAPTAPAPAAAPAPGPAAGGGGAFSNIGSRLASAISGDRGLFASAPDAAADEQIDPLTGASRGVSRRANNQAIMKMGVMLMAAGMRQSDDSRAQILSGLGGALDTSGAINNFARNRLEMAKLKLVEREQAQQMAMQSAAGAAFGIPVPGSASPVAGGLADPAASAAALGVPAAGGAPSAPMAPAGGSGAPMPAAPAGGAPMAPQGGGTAPAAPMTPVSQLPTTPPPAPQRGPYQPTEDDRRAAMMMPPAQWGEFYRDRAVAWNDQETTTEPYMQPGVGIVADVYKGGRKVRTEKIGDAVENGVLQQMPDGSHRLMMVRPDGSLAGMEEFRDPMRDARTEADIAVDQAGRTARATAREKRSDDQLTALIASGDMAAQQMANYDLFEKALDTGVYTGFGAETLLSARRIGASLGLADEQLTDQTAAAEIIRAIQNRMALVMRSPDGGMGMPGAVSDRDITFLKDSQVGLDRMGNREMLAAYRAVEQRKMDIAQMADEYVEEHGILDANFRRQVRLFANENPMFDNIFKAPPPAAQNQDTTRRDESGVPVGGSGTTPEGWPETNPDGSPGYMDLGNGVRMRRLR